MTPAESTLGLFMGLAGSRSARDSQLVPPIRAMVFMFRRLPRWKSSPTLPLTILETDAARAEGD